MEIARVVCLRDYSKYLGHGVFYRVERTIPLSIVKLLETGVNPQVKEYRTISVAFLRVTFLVGLHNVVWRLGWAAMKW